MISILTQSCVLSVFDIRNNIFPDCCSYRSDAWSNTDRLLSRYLAAALTLAMLPAGEMWSVVTLFPRNSKTWEFSIDWGAGTSLLWDTHRRWGQCDKNGPTQSDVLRRDLPACWKTTVSVYTWTCDPREKPPNLDTRCCSRTCSLSGQPWWLVPVKADGHQPHMKQRKMALSPLSFVWDPWKLRKLLCPLPSPGPPPWTARCHGDTPPSLLKWPLHHTMRDDAIPTSLLSCVWTKV